MFIILANTNNGLHLPTCPFPLFSILMAPQFETVKVRLASLTTQNIFCNRIVSITTVICKRPSNR